MSRTMKYLNVLIARHVRKKNVGTAVEKASMLLINAIHFTQKAGLRKYDRGWYEDKEGTGSVIGNLYISLIAYWRERGNNVDQLDCSRSTSGTSTQDDVQDDIAALLSCLSTLWNSLVVCTASDWVQRSMEDAIATLRRLAASVGRTLEDCVEQELLKLAVPLLPPKEAGSAIVKQPAEEAWDLFLKTVPAADPQPALSLAASALQCAIELLELRIGPYTQTKAASKALLLGKLWYFLARIWRQSQRDLSRMPGGGGGLPVANTMYPEAAIANAAMRLMSADITSDRYAKRVADDVTLAVQGIVEIADNRGMNMAELAIDYMQDHVVAEPRVVPTMVDALQRVPPRNGDIIKALQASVTICQQLTGVLTQPLERDVTEEAVFAKLSAVYDELINICDAYGVSRSYLLPAGPTDVGGGGVLLSKASTLHEMIMSGRPQPEIGQRVKELVSGFLVLLPDFEQRMAAQLQRLYLPLA